MATYILRVQLTKETEAGYTLIRDNLLSIGFTKRIKDQSGREWRLPNGNYLIESEKSLNYIMRAIKPLIANIDSGASIFLTKAVTGEITWHNLQKC